MQKTKQNKKPKTKINYIQKNNKNQLKRFMPVIPATREVEIQRIAV
jgi:hypothetical protein